MCGVGVAVFILLHIFIHIGLKRDDIYYVFSAGRAGWDGIGGGCVPIAGAVYAHPQCECWGRGLTLGAEALAVEQGNTIHNTY